MATKISVSIGSCKKLLPVGTKPLPEPTLAHYEMFSSIHLRAVIEEALMNLIRNISWNDIVEIAILSPKGQWVTVQDAEHLTNASSMGLLPDT